MRIIIEMDVFDDDGELTDESAVSGLSEAGYSWITQALMRFGEDIDIRQGAQ